jgi:hypothetical protein
MGHPVVSVVMSVFNGERFLPACMDSILAQRFADFEFIIVNDGSTDGTVSILEEYREADPRIRVDHQENRGLSPALNRGIGVARGDYIARMDADDIAVPDRLGRQVDFLERHPRVGIVGGTVEFIDGTGRSLRLSANPASDGELRAALQDDVCPFWHPTVLMRREIVERLGGYRAVVNGAEDYDLWWRLSEHCELANLQAVLVRYRLHPFQMSVQKATEMALSRLGTLVSAAARQRGAPDPLDSIPRLTPDVLKQQGVGQADIDAMIATWSLWSARLMSESGQDALSSSILHELMRSSAWDGGRNRRAVDVHAFLARLEMRNRRWGPGLVRYGQAIRARPVFLLRPIKTALGRFGINPRFDVAVSRLQQALGASRSTLASKGR